MVRLRREALTQATKGLCGCLPYVLHDGHRAREKRGNWERKREIEREAGCCVHHCASCGIDRLGKDSGSIWARKGGKKEINIALIALECRYHCVFMIYLSSVFLQVIGHIFYMLQLLART